MEKKIELSVLEAVAIITTIDPAASYTNQMLNEKVFELYPQLKETKLSKIIRNGEATMELLGYKLTSTDTPLTLANKFELLEVLDTIKSLTQMVLAKEMVIEEKTEYVNIVRKSYNNFITLECSGSNYPLVMPKYIADMVTTYHRALLNTILG